MKRILVLGLMASTLLTAMPAAAQREGRGRAEGGWVNGPRPNQSADPGEGRGRGWSRGPSEQRAAPAVTNTPVPASNAQPQWGNRQRDNGPRADAPGQGDRGGRQWSGNRQWSGDRDRGPTATPSAPTQPTPNAQRPSWSSRDRNDGRPGNWNRGDNDGRGGNWNRGDNSWNRNDNDRRDNDWRNNNNRQRDWNNNRPNDNRNWSYQRRLNDRDRWSDTRRWDNGWRNNNRYDWQRYRAQNRSIYRLPSYYAPYGWNYGYRRFSIGIYLSNILFASNYWLDDPYEYRLPPAYGPLRWVRYYDDALLVDIRDGYVVDVIHGFFW